VTRTPPTAIYTLSLHDALPISVPPARSESASGGARGAAVRRARCGPGRDRPRALGPTRRDRGLSHAAVSSSEREKAPDLYEWDRSEEHTSELQSRSDLVCRLLL